MTFEFFLKKSGCSHYHGRKGGWGGWMGHENDQDGRIKLNNMTFQLQQVECF